MLFLGGFTNMGSWLLWPLEGRFSEFSNVTSQHPYSGIIVLAGSELAAISTSVNQATLSDGGERLIGAAKLARLFPNLPIIHSGGIRWNEDRWSENDVAQRFFEDIGLDIARIRFDGNSYNTHTNAVESAKLIESLETGKWLLVTSAFHMPRSVGAFRQEGVNIQPYPVDFKTTLKYYDFFNFDVSSNLVLLDWAIHEYIGLIAYYITGRSNALYPDVQD